MQISTSSKLVICGLYFILFALYSVVMSVLFKYFCVNLFYCTSYYYTIIAFDNDVIEEATYLLSVLGFSKAPLCR